MATLVGAPDPLPLVLEQLRRDFDASGLAVFRVGEDGTQLVAGSGVVPGSPDAGRVMPIGDLAGTVLVVAGADLDSEDETAAAPPRRPGQPGHRRARAAAGVSRPWRRSNRSTCSARRCSTPCRTICAPPSRRSRRPSRVLLARDVHWSASQSDEFLETIDDQTDRLTRLVENLLDMSRLEAGVLTLRLEPVAIDDIVAGAVPSPTGHLAVAIPDDLRS